MLWCGDAECRQIGIPAWPGSSAPSCDIGFPYVLGVRCRLNTCALETKCSALLLALHFMTQSACALWQKLDLLWDLPAEDIPGCLSAQPAALFSSLMESQCQESTPWGFVWRHYARKPKVSPGHSHSTAPPLHPCWLLRGAPGHSPVPVHVRSDRSGRPAVPEDGGDPLPGGFLRWAPAFWCHRLRHPSLAVAAAHCHPADLLPPALLLVTALLLYLWPKKPGFFCFPRLGADRDWALLSVCTPLGAKRRFPGKRRGK